MPPLIDLIGTIAGSLLCGYLAVRIFPRGEDPPYSRYVVSIALLGVGFCILVWGVTSWIGDWMSGAIDPSWLNTSVLRDSVVEL